MKKQRHYFMLNKRSDYEKSAFENMEYDGEGFFLARGAVGRQGIFLSRILDSKEPETAWHRLVVKVNDASDAPYKISVYATEDPFMIWKGERVLLKHFIANQDIGMDEKLIHIQPYCKKEETGKPDLLLHDVKGRYLWISIEVYQQFGMNLRFAPITVYFPKQSWLSYLPELYEASDTEHFLDRYLSVFQSMYDDLNACIEQVPYLLDVETTKSEYLDFLCQWVGVVKSQMWSEEKKRLLLARATELFKIRGTRKGILEMLRLYLDEEGFLVERYHWNSPYLTNERKRLYENLYGASSYTITVIVKEESITSKREYQTLIEVLNSVKPAQADLNLVVLKPYLFLDGDSYLGINSTLTQYRTASLDGRSVMSFSAIGGIQQKERLEDEEF